MSINWNEIAKPPRDIPPVLARLAKAMFEPRNDYHLKMILHNLDRWDTAYFPAVPVTQSPKVAE